ncbi:hypothetical protein [Streptomyces scabiei]|uniref:hypothetical protein n=1 Tax=Streptomyces scabiei TaxID=1930 RepID=UPI0029AE12C0|nr:hypothetical protein [Streptomyces scabiei]MDX3519775.1 hypothetical protein [Streptomyces scabiei]
MVIPEVVTVSDARAGLSRIPADLSESGADADPVLIGAQGERSVRHAQRHAAHQARHHRPSTARGSRGGHHPGTPRLVMLAERPLPGAYDLGHNP